jgi:hypothetical protein
MSWKSTVVIAMLVVAPALGGCGWLVGAVVEELHREKAVKAYVYSDDIDDLWKGVRDLAGEYDCELPKKAKVEETFTCKTHPRRFIRIDRDDSGHRVRIEVEAVRTSDGRTVKERSRDIDLEWKLLERRHPEDARKIEAAAENRGDKAKKATRKLDELLD